MCIRTPEKPSSSPWQRVSGMGRCSLHQQNNSGLGGSLTVAFTINDTDSGNTFTNIFTESSAVEDVDSSLRPVGNDFFLFMKTVVHIYIDLTNQKLVWINAPAFYGYGGYAFLGVGSQSAATPYGYRYIYTLSRIVASNGAEDSTKNRVTGTLVFESPANSLGNSIGTNLTRDYGEFWLATPITASTPYTLLTDTSNNGIGRIVNLQAYPHYTHLSIYRTLDVGVSGTDPVSGIGNNREIYVWVGDFDGTLESVSDIKSDDELRAAFAAGFGLKTRFWQNLPVGEVGEIANSFLYVGTRVANTISYGQLADKTHIGFYNPAYQYFKLDDGVQLIAKSRT
jgi:hypothetical protein